MKIDRMETGLYRIPLPVPIQAASTPVMTEFDLVTVTVREPLQGDWKISKETQDHVKESAGSALWQVKVPAEGNAVLEYTAVVKW